MWTGYNFYIPSILSDLSDLSDASDLFLSNI